MERTMERIIRVTGKGRISIKPDRIRLLLKIEGNRKTYEETLQRSTEYMEYLKDVFEKLGFEKKDLKTLSFNIDVKYERYRDKSGDWKQCFDGYEFIHHLKIEFALDHKRLGKILYELTHGIVQPEFQISYTVSDPEEEKNKLLEKAIADSKEKAEVLTKAAGVDLGKGFSIEYSWEDMDFEISPIGKAKGISLVRDGFESYEIDVEADDIEAVDRVRVVWEIK